MNGSGDNPGIHSLGGSKEGFQAHRKCRHCLGNHEEIKCMASEQHMHDLCINVHTPWTQNNFSVAPTT